LRFYTGKRGNSRCMRDKRLIFAVQGLRPCATGAGVPRAAQPRGEGAPQVGRCRLTLSNPLKAPISEHLILKCDELLSSFAFKFCFQVLLSILTCAATPSIKQILALDFLCDAGRDVDQGYAEEAAARPPELPFGEDEFELRALEAGAYTQLEPCLTHKNTLHTLNTP